MELKKQLVGIVIRADGTVPFEDDVPDEIRSHILTHLVGHGAHIHPVDGTRHVKIANHSPELMAKIGGKAVT